MAVPNRKGFGSIILVESAKQFAHSVELDFAPQGLRYDLQLQLNAIEGLTNQQGSAVVYDLRVDSA